MNCVGLSDYKTANGRMQGTAHADSKMLQQLLLDFSLTAVNTWQQATYFGPRGASSRIDFVLVQQRDGDHLAHKVTYLQDLPQMMGLELGHVGGYTMQKVL